MRRLREADKHVEKRIPGALHCALTRINADNPVRAGLPFARTR